MYLATPICLRGFKSGRQIVDVVYQSNASRQNPCQSSLSMGLRGLLSLNVSGLIFLPANSTGWPLGIIPSRHLQSPKVGRGTRKLARKSNCKKKNASRQQLIRHMHLVSATHNKCKHFLLPISMGNERQSRNEGQSI